ncbi:hypothetical protein CcaverHIS002_0703510 [Cutaneotrichosporon cavernicola]|uniref:Uncharacterized protein n=1 Tax=Cutaneotrichosporon cavernicola TaxID=279322 RepID=A0AA48LA84_9TREE|nr:uncharacterized protein CcaverHIS019_0703580 [Cutaneotrichosporon cavernicola]BEI87005.1 hypothetical protein CcaverHIS002_0703510 [Cutaneotrichosporon cavernicola]BEI94777.1 hypothetical protein CcaverHIS019_0703580 [Cutaneotrichosporon cavernicola]BEJ02552.1 hypothetical protein CcaverHIS631_0703470 [Cutaneotrichosporon cavernicola]BEJ10309.1 hypothetical protein CcaverHIS641_0703440 [Cutaneotrichosporon cavernicola]
MSAPSGSVKHERHSAPLGERAFLADIAHDLHPPPDPHPFLAEPMPPPHAMAEYIRDLRLRLVDTEEEIEYLQGRVRRVEVDNHYLCQQVSALTEQREALRDRLEGRNGKGKGKEREGESGWKEGKVYKEAHYA